MKVLIYAIDFAPKIGGEENFLLLLAKGLANRLGQAKKGTKNWNVVLVTKTKANGFDDSGLQYPVIRQPSISTLWRLLGEAAVVQLSGPVLFPLLLGLLRRKPIVIAHHVYHSVCPNGLFLYEPTRSLCPGHFMARRYHECLRCNAVIAGWRQSLLMLLATFPRRWLSKRAVANVGVSKYVSQRIALPRNRTIYCGVPTSHVPISYLSAPSTVCFAYVGRLAREKGLPLLLEAARQLMDKGYKFRLKFIGDGPEQPSLKAMVASLSLQEQVQFTGFLQGEALRSALVDVAVVVMPSVCAETAGIAAIEHMMRGRLVIAADIGGLGEVVDRVGLKFPPGDVEALAACLRQVIEEPELEAELGNKAQARALELFREERMIEEYLQLYEQLARGKPSDSTP